MRSLILAATLLVCRPAVAGSADGATRAAAETLYREATQLARDGKFAAACPKYEQSQKLDPALGTMLRLADCWDRIGRTASAWALFLEAATVSEKSGELKRERIARERASALEPRLTKVVLKANFELPEDYELRIGGLPIAPDVWTVPLPVDPGALTLEARAPGYGSRKTVVEVRSSKTVVELEAPRLEKKPKVRPSLSTPPPAPAPTSDESSGGGWQTPTGIVVGVTGVAGLAAGGAFAYLAHARYQSSLGQCSSSDPNRCTSAGTEERNESLRYADLSTVLVATGGGLTLVGISLLLFSPSSDSEESPSEASMLRLQPVFGARSGGFSVSGRM